MTIIQLRLMAANASRREFLQDAFRTDPGFRVISEEADIEHGPAPDVFVLDLADPYVPQPRFWITTQLLYPAARFMAISEAPIDETALQAALQAGTYVVEWPASSEELCTVAREAFYGRPYRPRGVVFEVMATLLDRLNLNASYIHIGTLHLDLREGRAKLGQQFLNLSPLEFKVLLYLAQQAGRLISHTELLQEVWQDAPATKGSLNKVRTNLKRLRRKLSSAPQGATYILTIRGQGYRIPTDIE